MGNIIEKFSGDKEKAPECRSNQIRGQTGYPFPEDQSLKSQYTTNTTTDHILRFRWLQMVLSANYMRGARPHKAG